MNWSTREHGSWQTGWSPTWPRSPLGEDPVRTPLAPVQCFERQKLFLGKCILGICQDHDVLGHLARFAMYTTSRRIRSGSSRSANNDYSRILTSTRSNCCFQCIFISQIATSRQTRQPLKGRVVPMLLTSRFSCCDLDWGFRFGHNSSIFHSMARRTRRGTDFVGWESSTTQLKNPSRMLKDSVTYSPDSTFCLGTSPRVVIWFSGRCPVS